MASRKHVRANLYRVRETNEPIAIKAVFDMLSKLKDDDVL